MGKLILCAGKQAEHPYYFPSSGARVYTIEELCYYIYHNIETVGEELISPELVIFLRDEIGLVERAHQLDRLLSTHAGIKDIIVTILCSADYYEEEEIKQLLTELDFLNNMTPLQRKKRNADHSLAEGKYKDAMKGYRDILHSRDSAELNQTEYGNIMHNMALLHVKAGAFITAAEEFHDAYERNGNPESLKEYIYALKFGKQEAKFESEMNHLSENRILTEQMENELYFVSDTEENTYDAHEVSKLKEMREDGRIAEYYKAAEELIDRLKNKYRAENG